MVTEVPDLFVIYRYMSLLFSFVVDLLEEIGRTKRGLHD